jgi:hypothetical protein
LTLTLSVTAESTWEKSTAANIVVFRFLVRDRLGQFAASFDAVLADAGIGVLKIPPRCVTSPWNPTSVCRPRAERPRVRTGPLDNAAPPADELAGHNRSDPEPFRPGAVPIRSLASACQISSPRTISPTASGAGMSTSAPGCTSSVPVEHTGSPVDGANHPRGATCGLLWGG